MESERLPRLIGEAMMPYSLDYPYADSVYITVAWCRRRKVFTPDDRKSINAGTLLKCQEEG